MAAERLLPKPETVIVAVEAIGVNLNHSPYVVLAVAPPHVPTGATLVAFLMFSLLDDVPLIQVVAGVIVTGDAQLACE